MCLPANRVALRNRWNRATEVIYADDNRILADRCLPFGYRKKTTWEYVCNKYRSNFGWKNTYYQHAVCVVEINVNDYF